jgi:hypothetical protein
LRIYGSCQTRTALNSSNVNVEILFDSVRSCFSRALYNAEQVLKEHARGKRRELLDSHVVCSCKHTGLYSTVVTDYDNRYPCVYFKCQQPPSIADVSFVLAVRNEEAFQIGRQLEIYMRLHPYALPLAHAFRYFGKVRIGVAVAVEFTFVGSPSGQLPHRWSRPVRLRFDGRSLSATY